MSGWVWHVQTQQANVLLRLIVCVAVANSQTPFAILLWQSWLRASTILPISLSSSFHSTLLLFYTYSIWYSHLLTANSYAGNNNERNLITTLKWPASFGMQLREYKYQLLLLTFQNFSLFVTSRDTAKHTNPRHIHNIFVNNQYTKYNLY